jgi:hypothetical protein
MLGYTQVTAAKTGRVRAARVLILAAVEEYFSRKPLRSAAELRDCVYRAGGEGDTSISLLSLSRATIPFVCTASSRLACRRREAKHDCCPEKSLRMLLILYAPIAFPV